MSDTLPYVYSSGTLKKVLNRMLEAAKPAKFTYDFLENTLGTKGGDARSCVALFKKIGLLATDGTPTALYDKFKNRSKTGSAVAEAIKKGYHQFFEMREDAQNWSQEELKGAVVQITGDQPDSSRVQKIVSTFNALKDFADFRETLSSEPEKSPFPSQIVEASEPTGTPWPMGLSYTINLNLPETNDIEVFNAIFKSLRENLLFKS